MTTHTFYGEASAMFLVRWLNGPGETPWKEWAGEQLGVFSGSADADTEARTRIADLIRQVKQFTEMAGELYARERIAPDDREWQQFRWLEDSINKCLGNYQASPLIRSNPLVLGKDGFLKAHFPGRAPYGWVTAVSLTPTVLLQELKAASLVQQAEKEGWLNRVRECRVCGRWLFARKDSTRHCTAKCRKKEYQSTKKYKDWRHKHYVRWEKKKRARDEKKNRAGSRPRGSK